MRMSPKAKKTRSHVPLNSIRTHEFDQLELIRPFEVGANTLAYLPHLKLVNNDTIYFSQRGQVRTSYGRRQ